MRHNAFVRIDGCSTPWLIAASQLLVLRCLPFFPGRVGPVLCCLGAAICLPYGGCVDHCNYRVLALDVYHEPDSSCGVAVGLDRACDLLCSEALLFSSESHHIC